MAKSDIKPWGFVGLLYFNQTDPPDIIASSFRPTIKEVDTWAAKEMADRRKGNQPMPSRVAIAEVKWVIDG
jgi:hypothetical protein